MVASFGRASAMRACVVNAILHLVPGREDRSLASRGTDESTDFLFRRRRVRICSTYPLSSFRLAGSSSDGLTFCSFMASIWICNSWYSKSAVGCCCFACRTVVVVVVLVAVATGLHTRIALAVVVALLRFRVVVDGAIVCWSLGENAVHDARQHIATAIFTSGRSLRRCCCRRRCRRFRSIAPTLIGFIVSAGSFSAELGYRTRTVCFW
mmetsp:Transcript_10227/g.21461  ORF Transcript_10227/g.21461 Transcript_10227/m.21461 type:complete len:209 (-) Transcript_10227:219-845(-)